MWKIAKLSKFYIRNVENILNIIKIVHQESEKYSRINQNCPSGKWIITPKNQNCLIRKVEARINEEAERATHYLDETTEPRIVEVNISFEILAAILTLHKIHDT